MNLLDRKDISIRNFLPITARDNIKRFQMLNNKMQMVAQKTYRRGAPTNVVTALRVLHVNGCLWRHICVVRNTDMPLWSKGRDGRCRAVGQIGLCLRRYGARHTGCIPVSIQPDNMCRSAHKCYFSVGEVVDNRRKVYVSTCNKRYGEGPVEHQPNSSLLLLLWLHPYQQQRY